ncbi:DNA cytosine methyltransferase [Mycobacteroides abscessus]|uniref:DNA cytosine methyltransferase n=2 Tax=Mycobacteroides abscessus TaxID=36809 RepID=UPI000929A08C|nr:DNA cytosine methyltransferase [Mycobacteroides abscessus]SIA23682.1 site-specific DNA methylase [Mycobacteroides abscessus subsp. abscessus]SKT81269.1 site-specific DNA methylase [Mycobacteroides abscessus subsp. massiliense]SKT98898.1 site-specific DNA methylase [Mycobacteroides abscessus subsp. massiliense]
MYITSAPTFPLYRLSDAVASRGVTGTDMFCGGGGSSLGLHRAGVKIVAAANHSPTALATHARNSPDTEHFNCNLREADFRKFPRTDLLWASSSCTWHAPSGRRVRLTREQELQQTDLGAIDRATAFAIIAAAEVHLYDVIVVENVPAFRSWVLHEWWADGLRALGYDYSIHIIDSADLGMPQARPRYYGIAARNGIEVDLTLPTMAAVPAATLLDEGPLRRTTRRMYITAQVEQIQEPDVLHLVTARRNARARRADQHPLATIAASGNHHWVAAVDERGNHWHRMLNTRERARAQGFPDDYEFVGPTPEHGLITRQIGNAVPVGVAQFIGERVIEALGRKEIAQSVASEAAA